MKPSFIFRGLCAAAFLISLAACGGGNDSGAPATPPPASGQPTGSTPQAPVLSCAP